MGWLVLVPPTEEMLSYSEAHVLWVGVGQGIGNSLETASFLPCFLLSPYLLL